MSRLEEFIKNILLFLLAIAIGIGLRTFVFGAYIVEGQSMSPTMQNGQVVMGLKLLGDIERFDIITFKGTNGKDMVKRVIALPGDRICYEGDQLYINDQLIDEVFLDERKAQESSLVTEDFDVADVVPQGMYFVMGDNRDHSTDSRDFGFISHSSIYSKVKLILFPFEYFRWDP